MPDGAEESMTKLQVGKTWELLFLNLKTGLAIYPHFTLSYQLSRQLGPISILVPCLLLGTARPSQAPDCVSDANHGQHADRIGARGSLGIPPPPFWGHRLLEQSQHLGKGGGGNFRHFASESISI